MDTGNNVLIAPYGIDKKGKAFPPNPTQKKVLEWVDKQRKLQKNGIVDHIPVLYLQGGVGSGKSRAVLAPIIELLIEIAGIRILWGRNDLKDLKLSIMDKFFEIFPPELFCGKSEQYNWYDVLQERGTKSRIYFNGLKDLAGFGSQEFGVIAVTETHEITEQAYRTLKRRCRQEGVINLIILEGEAPNEGHWLANLTNPAHQDYDPDIEMWTLSTYENWENLPSAYKGSLESMPKAWQRKYLLGGFGFIPDGKPYYSGFSELLHTADLQYNPDKPLICGWDFGYHHPICLITQIDLQDRWVWLREIRGQDVTIDKFGDYVISQLNLFYPNATIIYYGDPAVIQKNDKSEHTSWQILNGKGINIRYKTSEYRLRKEIIEQKLSTLIGQKPAILLDRTNCRTAIEGFLGGYHYPLRKAGQEVTHKDELPVRDGFYEHVMNAGEYIAVNMFKPFKSNFRKTRKKRGAV
jgi:hypothetical protein